MHNFAKITKKEKSCSGPALLESAANRTRLKKTLRKLFVTGTQAGHEKFLRRFL
jgi:hypothetical protein